MSDPFVVEGLPEEDRLIQEVRRAVAECLGQRLTAARDVAGRLCMSERTLRRRLAERQTHFSALFDEVRCEWATQRLCTTPLPIGDIAFELGFSERSAFHRAFKRWTGRTPLEFRNGLKLHEASDASESSN